MAHPAWTPLATGDGTLTLRCEPLGEACHGRVGAWTEAWQRYAVPCELPLRAREGGTLRLLDVGTGLGWNLAAALHALEGSAGALEPAALDVVSLERDPTVIEATLDLARRGDLAPPALLARHAPVAAALEAALGEAARAAREGVPLGSGRLTLLLGDARQTLRDLDPARTFDAVFLDPFSPRRDPPLWGEAFLGEVARRMGPGALLSTYSAAFPVRARLAAQGLEVGRGPRVGAKAEGTLAGRGRALPPLAPRVARRLAREGIQRGSSGGSGAGPRPPRAPSPPGDESAARG